MIIHAFLMEGQKRLIAISCESPVDLSNLIVRATGLKELEIDQKEIIDGIHRKAKGLRIPGKFFNKVKYRWELEYSE
jgi:hypothetical protein